MNKLTHLDDQGAARMVDISSKEPSIREAIAEATITLSREAFEAIVSSGVQKGDVFAASRIAGIMAAKKTSELIPLCHPIALTKANIDFEPDTARGTIRIVASAKTSGPTGVEMEALMAASIAALTIYDMIKALDKAAAIGQVRLVSKSGGKSGDFFAPAAEKPAYRSAGMRKRARPATLMGAVSAATPTKADANRDTGAKREAFRSFMTSRHLRATQWAKEAGVPPAHIYAFLTGKARSIPTNVAEQLARAARVRIQDMFK